MFKKAVTPFLKSDKPLEQLFLCANGIKINTIGFNFRSVQNLTGEYLADL